MESRVLAKVVSVSTSILFRCDGSHEIGLGHVRRCLALADQFRSTHNANVAFAVRASHAAADSIREFGYPVHQPPGDTDFCYGRWLTEILEKEQANALILDVRDDLPLSVVRGLRERGVLIATVDDPSDRRLAADLAFYPPVPQVHRLDWTGFTGQLHVGWEWVILGTEFTSAVQEIHLHGERSRTMTLPRQLPPYKADHILVTMGGSDPAGLTLKALSAIEDIDANLNVTVVLGPHFNHEDVFQKLCAQSKLQVDIRQDVTNMAALMAEADLAIASFGVTAYELAAMGVPAIYLCLTEDHVESASALVSAGAAVSAGLHTDVTADALRLSVTNFLQDSAKLAEISMKAKSCVDLFGAKRLCDRIVSELNAIHDKAHPLNVLTPSPGHQ